MKDHENICELIEINCEMCNKIMIREKLSEHHEPKNLYFCFLANKKL